MDGDWDEVGRITVPPPVVQQIPMLVTALIFDNSYDLLWTGNDHGRVTSFYGTELQRYTSYMMHSRAETVPNRAVRQILLCDRGVISLSSTDLHMAMRKGPAIWHMTHPNLNSMLCMSYTSKGTSELLVAGDKDLMLVVDVAKGEVVKEIATEHRYNMMRRGRYICAATVSGSVNLLNPASLEVVKSWNAHSARISDMDAQHDFVVTCGYSLRQGHSYMLDPFLNVFDIKKMASMPPIPFPAGAAFVRMHPLMQTTSIVLSQTGQVHVIDLMNPNTSNMRQANVLTYVQTFEIAPSGEALALADGDCSIHLWGSPAKIRFVDLPAPVEFAAPPEEPPPIEWTPETPLGSIGLPYYRDALVSAWPDATVEVGAPPARLDPAFLASLTKADWGLYGKNMHGRRRNRTENTREMERAARVGIQAPKFLSEKARESAKSSDADPREDVISGALERLGLDGSKTEIPAMYRLVEIKYSRFGVDDFDFRFYNKTQYSGLETDIPNAYANSLLQLLHYTPMLRNLALRHVAGHCPSETCLLCELAYLFDMLQKGEGSVCHATNFLKTLSLHPKAGALGVLEEEPRGYSLPNVLQALTRFLLDRMVQDSLSRGGEALDQALATSVSTSIRCTSCKVENTSHKHLHCNEFLYPQNRTHGRSQRPAKVTFSQLLKTSIEMETTHKGWCNNCRRYMPMLNRKLIHSMPAVLSLNCGIQTQEHKQLWATPGWVPEEIGVIVEAGQLYCYEGEDLKLHLQRGFHQITVYSLVGVVIDIENQQTHQRHLVAMVNVAHSEPVAPAESQWHLFNDFLVGPVSREEALNFSQPWKTPATLVFQVQQANNTVDSEWKSHIDTSVLYDAVPPTVADKSYTPLDPQTERPGPDTIVALDTEFVAVRLPEIEVKSDGNKEVIRPTTYALARVSVVRAQGRDEGVPFIDDYVVMREPVVDFLTSYSGIKPEDLDLRLTRHNLVTLKQTYRKLWVLLNLGCKILGHGLSQDIRVINMQIPPAQIIDTIKLFYLPKRWRKLSLAFLAWYFLKEDIQLETHDSIEDSRTALKLYRKYLEFEDAGVLDQMLQELYHAGQSVNFKPPKRDGAEVPARVETPPLGGDEAGPSTPARGAPRGQQQQQSAQQDGEANMAAAAYWTPSRSPLR